MFCFGVSRAVGRTEGSHSEAFATSKAIDESQHRISVARRQLRCGHMQSSRAPWDEPAARGRQWSASPKASSATSLHSLPSLSIAKPRAELRPPAPWEEGHESEGGCRSRDSPAHCHLCPSSAGNTRGGGDAPQVPLPEWESPQAVSSLGLVTSLRPVCPTSQGPESLPGRRTYCSLRLLFQQEKQQPPLSQTLLPGSAFLCSGSGGLSGLAKQRLRRRKTRTESTRTECVP